MGTESYVQFFSRLKRAIALILVGCSLLLVGCAESGGGGGGSGGGGGDDGGNGNGSNGDGDGGSGGGGGPSLPAEVELSISPFNEGLRIQWHNLPAIERAGGIGIHLNLTSNDSPPELLRERIAIEDLTDNDNRYELGGLSNGTAYRLVEVRVELPGNVSRVIDIVWSEPWQTKTNALDQEGNGIVVGVNYDGDGRTDGLDGDIDDDGVNNIRTDGTVWDLCRRGELDWLSNSTSDHDGDGCRDSDEDWDNDNDGVNNTRADGTVWDLCRRGELDWQSNSTNDYDGDGCRDSDEDWDNDNDGVNNTRTDGTEWDLCRQGELDWQSNSTSDHDSDGCRNDEDWDNDNDGVNNSRADGTVWDLCRQGELDWLSNSTNDHDRDGCRDEGEDKDDDNDDKSDDVDMCRLGELDWQSNQSSDYDGDGCRDSDEDIDDDGDGLIEIGTAAELDAVRWVLNGTGFKANETAMLDQTGCGNRADMMVCNGYELVGNISLTGYIAKTNAMAGWKPIASDVDVSNNFCDGNTFTAIFEGNGFVISGLFINRSREDCIGLFGRATGIIRDLGVMADKVEGNSYVGGLVGDSTSASIVHSYVVSGEVRGSSTSVGGLVGSANFASIVQSYAVSGEVGSHIDSTGGLVGDGTSASIVQSYAVSGEVYGEIGVGGLVGWSSVTSIVHSYAVSGEVRGRVGSSFVGGLVGQVGTATASYWDTETSGRTNSAVGSGQTTLALRSPTDYTDIYATWDDGAMVDGINDNTTIWCDEDASGMIEDDERRDDTHANGDNRVWDFGMATDYPALRCTPDSLADQRAWWSLNSTNQPELDQDRLNAYLNGTLP